MTNFAAGSVTAVTSPDVHGKPAYEADTLYAQYRFERNDRPRQISEREWLEKTYGAHLWRSVPNLQVDSFSYGQTVELRDLAVRHLPRAYQMLDAHAKSIELGLAKRGLRLDQTLIDEGREAVRSLALSAALALIGRAGELGRLPLKPSAASAGGRIPSAQDLQRTAEGWGAGLQPQQIRAATQLADRLNLTGQARNEVIALFSSRGLDESSQVYRSLPRSALIEKNGKFFIKPTAKPAGVVQDIYNGHLLNDAERTAAKARFPRNVVPPEYNYDHIVVSGKSGVFTGLSRNFVNNYPGSERVVVKIDVGDLVRLGARPYPDSGSFADPSMSVFWALPKEQLIPVKVVK